jgi:hypothetical protein
MAVRQTAYCTVVAHIIIIIIIVVVVETSYTNRATEGNNMVPVTVTI